MTLRTGTLYLDSCVSGKMLRKAPQYHRYIFMVRAASMSGTAHIADAPSNIHQESKAEAYQSGEDVSNFTSPLVEFDNVQAAFKHRPSSELVHGLMVLEACKYKRFVDRADDIINAMTRLCGPGLTAWAIKKTFFGHFCAGVESVAQLPPLVNKLNNSGIAVALSYAAEGNVGEALDRKAQIHGVEERTQAIIESIRAVAKNSREPTMAFKLTAITDPNMLQKVSQCLLGQSTDKQFGSQGKASDIATAAMSLDTLNQEDREEFGNLVERSRLICQCAEENQVRILIDAEQTWVQPAIDYIVREMQKEFNKNSGVVLNTYQCYLKGSIEHIASDLNHACEGGYYFGGKLVRGAYMVTERKLAAKNGCPSPIHDCKLDTDANYDRCVKLVLNGVAQGSAEVVVASHSQSSVENTVKEMVALDMKAGAPVYFAQLFGMADYLTYSLALHGYKAMKLVSYGPVHDLMPWLVRRAQENSDIMGGCARDTKYLRAELLQRVMRSTPLSGTPT